MLGFYVGTSIPILCFVHIFLSKQSGYIHFRIQMFLFAYFFQFHTTFFGRYAYKFRNKLNSNKLLHPTGSDCLSSIRFRENLIMSRALIQFSDRSILVYGHFCFLRDHTSVSFNDSCLPGGVFSLISPRVVFASVPFQFDAENAIRPLLPHVLQKTFYMSSMSKINYDPRNKIFVIRYLFTEPFCNLNVCRSWSRTRR